MSVTSACHHKQSPGPLFSRTKFLTSGSATFFIQTQNSVLPGKHVEGLRSELPTRKSKLLQVLLLEQRINFSLENQPVGPEANRALPLHGTLEGLEGGLLNTVPHRF